MSVMAKARSTGTKVLAWISWILGAAGGASLAATWVAGWIGAPFHWVSWAQILLKILLAVGVIGMLIDMFLDFVPDRLAVWCAILLPSLATATSGKLAGKITDLSNRLLSQVNAGLTGWIGDTSKLVVAAVCIAVSLAVAKRVVKKSSGGGDL